MRHVASFVVAFAVCAQLPTAQTAPESGHYCSGGGCPQQPPQQPLERAAAVRRARPRGGAARGLHGIAYASFAPLDAEVFVADADGSRARPLSPDPGWDANASFSTAGQWVVFTSNRRGSADIFRVHPDGTGLERLTDDPAFDDQAALSPDGRRLAFVSTRTGRAEIWLLDLTTRALKNLTGSSGGSFRPAWSPDGTWIAFSSDRASPHPVRPGSFESTTRCVFATRIPRGLRTDSGSRLPAAGQGSRTRCRCTR